MRKAILCVLLVGAFVFAQGAGKLYLTDKELSAFNGKEGQKSYVAVDGVIYDVSSAKGWENGSHHGYLAGQDLTMYIKLAPHGNKVLADLPVVGKLVKGMNDNMVTRVKNKKLKITDGLVYDVSTKKGEALVVGKIIN